MKTKQPQRKKSDPGRTAVTRLSKDQRTVLKGIRKKLSPEEERQVRELIFKITGLSLEEYLKKLPQERQDGRNKPPTKLAKLAKLVTGLAAFLAALAKILTYLGITL